MLISYIIKINTFNQDVLHCSWALTSTERFAVLWCSGCGRWTARVDGWCDARTCETARRVVDSLHCETIPPTTEISSFSFSLCHYLATRLSASDSFTTMALYKSIYLLTYSLQHVSSGNRTSWTLMEHNWTLNTKFNSAHTDLVGWWWRQWGDHVARVVTWRELRQRVARVERYGTRQSMLSISLASVQCGAV